MELTSSTISAYQHAALEGNCSEPGLVLVKNTILVESPGRVCTSTASALVTSLGHNLDSDGSCNLTDPTDLPGTDPMLGPLQDNGGPTFTHALLPGSPAIDAVPLADCTYDDDGDPGTPEVPLTEDQRGVARPQGDGCDIGAYEMTACANGIDDDGDGFVDTDDPACSSGSPAFFPDPSAPSEETQCQDGIDNDGDGLIDFDGGQSIWGNCTGVACGVGMTWPDCGCPPEVSDPDNDGFQNWDMQCGTPWKDIEQKQGGGGCGLGTELLLLLPPLMWLSLRRRRQS